MNKIIISQELQDAIDLLRVPNKDDQRKKRLIDEIKKAFGPNCIKEERRHFKRKHIIFFQYEGNEIIIDYHFGRKEFGKEGIRFFGTDIDFIDKATAYIENNSSRRIYYYVLLNLILSEEEEIYFAIPIFFIKNNKQDISKSEYKDSIPPGYKFHTINKRDKYWLRLKNNRFEDLSIFQTNIKDLLNQNLMNRYEEEKEKYFNNKKDKEELLRKLVK